MLHFVFTCQRRAHDFYGIVFQTLILETSDIYFDFRIFQLNSFTLRGLVLTLFFQTIQKLPNMNDVTLYDSTRIIAAENLFIRGRKQLNELKSKLSILCNICSRRNMVGSLNPSENILYATREVYCSLSSKRISLVEYEGCLYTLSVVVRWHCSFWTRKRHPCKLEKSTKCFYYQIHYLNFLETMTLVISVNLSEKAPLMLHFCFHLEIFIKINFHPWLVSMAQTCDGVFFFEHRVFILLKRL